MDGGKLILDASWMDETTVYAHPCGWTDEYINALPNRESHGFPKATTTYGANNENEYTFTIPVSAKPAL